MGHRGRPALVCFHQGAKLRPAKAKIRASAARLDNRDTDLERRDFLAEGVKKAFKAPLARVIERTARKGRLAAIR